MPSGIDLNLLPPDHLFWLSHRDQSDDGVDWQAVLGRLETNPEEAMQWIRTTEGCTYLFLHKFLDDLEYDTSVDDLMVEILEKTLEVFPHAIACPDDRGYLPLHIISRCGRRNQTTRSPSKRWSLFTTKIFYRILTAHPQAAKTIAWSDSRTVLHCFVDQYAFTATGPDKQSRLEVLQAIFDAFPEAAGLPDRSGRCPLHLACWKGGKGWQQEIKFLLERSPDAAKLPCQGGTWMRGLTPLLITMERPVKCEEAKTVLEACPSACYIENQTRLQFDYRERRGLVRVGDALDYIALAMCETVGMPFIEIQDDADSDSDSDEDMDYYDFDHYIDYVASNLAFPGRASFRTRKEVYRFCRQIDLAEHIIRCMSGNATTSLLHGLCQGRLCRPWHLVFMRQMMFVRKSGPLEAQKVDDDGNLPLHLFLSSCLIEQDRAIARGYAKDSESYEKAVSVCFELLLELNPEAVSIRNGQGRLPLHLAAEQRSLPFQLLLEKLLQFDPQQGLNLRDKMSGFYPFAIAAMGANANIDSTFLLLLRNPSVISHFLD